ncbi:MULTISPECIES: PAS domain S-box protein [Halorussus]|uniref:PAS domain S-box protein n=1 Tax=Halorussus TaxID=1070314 RepID=UPI00209E649D|nr:PAS domain S-box protein [Halorussus vallis]USZ78056.1 PAS domain S-box protein [Halorussus vallis]
MQSEGAGGTGASAPARVLYVGDRERFASWGLPGFGDAERDAGEAHAEADGDSSDGTGGAGETGRSDTLDAASVETATEALDFLSRTDVSCVVSAGRLPDVDAPTLVEGVRELFPTLPVVVVDETADPDLASAVLDHEATDFVDWRGESHQPRQAARRIEAAVARYRAERAAERTEAYFDALVSRAPDAVLTIDTDGRIAFANQAVESVFGYDPAELVGEPLTTLVPERLRESHLAAFDRYVETGARTMDWDRVELPGRHADGHEVPLSLSIREVSCDGRRRFSAVVRDATDRRAVADERRRLEREKEFVDGALDALPDVFFSLDASGRLVRWNDRANAVTGYDDADLRSRPATDLFADEYADRINDAIARVFDQGVARVQAPLRTADGREIPYEFTGALLEDDDGNPRGITGIGRDVTDRKRREAELQASRERYQRLVETAPNAIFIVDAETGTIIDTNEAAADLLDRPREEVVGMHQSELHPSEEADRYRGVFESHVEDGGARRDDDDYYVVRNDGTEVPVEINAGVTEVGDRTLNQAVFRDISERKQREETLAKLREATRELMSAESKRDICEVAVSTARDILDLPISGIHLYDDAEAVLWPAATTSEAEALFDGVPTFEAGESLAWEVYSSGTARLYDSVRDEKGAYNRETAIQTEMILPLGDHGVLTSGSTRSETFTESKRNLAKILAANAESALDRADREQTIERQRDQLQAELEEVFERIDDGFLALDDEWRFTYVNERAERLLGAAETELYGEVLWDTLPEVAESGASEAFRRAVDRQKPVSREAYLDAFGAWFEFHAYPSESGLSVYFRDVTERKHREQQLRQQNERLESFASMLAHEVRNPLAIAQIYLQTARTGDDDAFDEIETALGRIEEMVDVLLVMTRGDDATIDPEPVSLAERAAEAWSKVSATGDLEVETDRVLEAEPHHVRHLLENLFRNAVEHVDGDVTVRVGDLPGGFYVEDDGPGVPAEDRERVFEAGYTTGAEGIGLGLTFISQLAELYGWDRRLTEGTDGGARFEFRNVSPAAEEAPSE